MSRWSVAIPEPGGSVSQIREVRFFEKMSFSQPRGPPEKVGGPIFCVKSKNNWGPLSSLFLILAIKMHFWPINYDVMNR